MLSEERRRDILEMLHSDGRVLVTDLAKRFRTSLITIRKDLESLHHDGQLERTHGGALPLKIGAMKDRTLGEKERLHRQEKIRIAAAAAQMIRQGQVIILDSGTTTTAIARACRTFQKLDDHHQRDEYCGGVGGYAGGSTSDGRGAAQEFILAGWTACGRNFTESECGFVVSGRGWIRCALRADNAESVGGTSQSSDGRIGATHRGGV